MALVMRRSLAFVLTLMPWLGSGPEAEACICIAVGPACQTLWSADAVFSGTVLAIETVPNQADPDGGLDRRATMAVTHPYRGVAGERIEIFTSGSSCGYEFVVGETYLVYANRSPESKVLTTGVCSHTTRLIADAQDDLRYLDNLDSIKPGTRVTGTVIHVEDTASGDDFSRLPAVGFVIRLVGDAGTFEALSDELGQVGFDGLPVSTYTAEVVPRPKFAAMFEPMTVSLPDPRACADMFFAVRYDGRIVGRLVGPAGEPVAETPMELRSADGGAEESHDLGRGTLTGASGQFSLGPISPGRYLLGIGLEQPGEGDGPSPPTWYPGVTSRDDATVIAVGQGEHLTLGDFRLPTRLREVTVRGRVRWPSYVRPGEISVGVWDADADSPVRDVRAAGVDGSFEFVLYEGRRYVIKAKGTRPGTLMMQAQSGVVEPSVAMPDVILRLRP